MSWSSPWFIIRKSIDFKTFNNMLADLIQHNKATVYKNGELVAVEERGFDMAMLIRLGEVGSYWTERRL